MIRPARDDDYAAYAVLHRVLVPEDPVPPYTRFCAEIAQTIQVAERDGQVVGYVDTLLFDAAAHVHARHDHLMVLVEGDEALTAMLEAAGATVRRHINHMSGDVP